VQLEEQRDVDEKEYASGFWAPDLEGLENVEALRKWSGHWVGLGQIKFVRLTKEGVKLASRFPPTGES